MLNRVFCSVACEKSNRSFCDFSEIHVWAAECVISADVSVTLPPEQWWIATTMIRECEFHPVVIMAATTPEPQRRGREA